MQHHEPRAGRRSVRIYGMLLYLYPERFRRQFGSEMREAFEQMLEDDGPGRAWKTVGPELAPTLLREHVACIVDGVNWLVSRVGMLVLPLRVLLACVLPAVGYVWLVRHATRAEDVAVLTLWLGAVSAGIFMARGRGWASAAWAVVGGVLTISVLIAREAATRSPDILSVAPLLLLLSAAAAFTLASYVRLFVEGVELGRAAPASMARA